MVLKERITHKISSRPISEPFQVHKKIEDIDDIESVLFLSSLGREDPLIEFILIIIPGASVKILKNHIEAIDCLYNSPPDIFFIHPDGRAESSPEFHLCHTIRDTDYGGVVILITDCVKDAGGFPNISSTGFDSYILTTDNKERVEDAILSAIIHRKRREKYIITIDGSLNAFYTIDGDGRVHEINKKGTEKSGYSPKEIVKEEMYIGDVGTLEAFDELIQPLITFENTGKSFTHTIEEGNRIYQVQTNIQNVPTIGLVAVLTKTDITKTIYSNTLDILVNSITLLSHRDHYTAGHSSRVLHYTMHFAQTFGYDKDSQFSKALYFAAFLHDIGKIGIRDHLLLKSGKLTSEEQLEFCSHAEKGYEMLYHYEFLRDSLDLILYHHERQDGKGYPRKLKGDKIPLGSSIIAIIDAFDAITTNRPYQKALPCEKAISEVKNNFGTQFNGEIGEKFLSIITPELIDNTQAMASKPISLIAHELVETILKE